MSHSSYVKKFLRVFGKGEEWLYSGGKVTTQDYYFINSFTHRVIGTLQFSQPRAGVVQLVVFFGEAEAQQIFSVAGAEEG